MMTKKNKRLVIATSVVGFIIAAMCVALTIYLVINIRSFSIAMIEGLFDGLHIAALAVVFPFYGLFLSFLIITIAMTTILSIYAPAISIKMLKEKNTEIVRKYASWSYLIAITYLILPSIVFIIDSANKFINGNYLIVALEIAYVILSITWFSLNVATAKSFKQN